MFIITITYTTTDAEALAALRPSHYAYFGPHFDSGLFLLGGRLVPPTGGVMVAQGADREVIEEIFSGEPYFQAGLSTYLIQEVLPTKVAAPLAGAITAQPF